MGIAGIAVRTERNQSGRAKNGTRAKRSPHFLRGRNCFCPIFRMARFRSARRECLLRRGNSEALILLAAERKGKFDTDSRNTNTTTLQATIKKKMNPYSLIDCRALFLSSVLFLSLSFSWLSFSSNCSSSSRTSLLASFSFLVTVSSSFM